MHPSSIHNPIRVAYHIKKLLFSAAQIRFAPQDGDLEAPSGAGVRLTCRTQSPVRECQWSWRQLNQSQPWDVEMRRFPVSGNDSMDCDLGLPAARSEHEGFWTCGARLSPNSPFVQTLPIRLLISEGTLNSEYFHRLYKNQKVMINFFLSNFSGVRTIVTRDPDNSWRNCLSALLSEQTSVSVRVVLATK